MENKYGILSKPLSALNIPPNPPPPEGEFRLTDDDDFRITSDASFRVIDSL